MNKSNILGVYDASAQEISIDYNGFNYLIVFGKHVNGGYFAIINHGVCGELANFEDTFWNAESIGNAVKNYDTGKALALAIAAFAEV